MIKLAAFDWNGTILADTFAVVRSQSVILRHFGFKPTNVKEFQNTYAMPIRNYWLNMGLSGKFFDKHYKDVQHLFMATYEPLESFCRTRSGSREALSWIHKKKIDTVMFSNHPEPHIHKQLRRLGLSKYFSHVLARQPHDHSLLHFRTKDILLHKYVKSRRYKPNEVICIGDTDEEIEIGKKFRYFTVALTGGYQSTKRLRAAKPDFLIHNLNELKKIITRL
ncbi:MAG: HAD family hydrolase [Candidatus Doudnabacteria bacterium]|nr:HAD family hydrolase [Candidatus Doudnabacteria bacterium]